MTLGGVQLSLQYCSKMFSGSVPEVHKMIHAVGVLEA